MASKGFSSALSLTQSPCSWASQILFISNFFQVCEIISKFFFSPSESSLQVNMNVCREFLSLTVPGLAEGRPSLLLGDKIVASLTGTIH